MSGETWSAGQSRSGGWGPGGSTEESRHHPRHREIQEQLAAGGDAERKAVI